MVFFELFGNGAGEVLVGDDFFGFERLLCVGERFFDEDIGGTRRNMEGFGVDFEFFLDFGEVESLRFHRVTPKIIMVAVRR